MVIIESNGVRTSSSTVPKRTFYDSEKIWVTDGGVITQAKLKPALMYISSGGVANMTDIRESGFVYVSEGGVANETDICYGGSLVVLSGGTANDTLVESMGGRMVVSAFGEANRTTVTDLTSMTVSASGVANSTILRNGGSVLVESAGIANGTIVETGAGLHIGTGGAAFDTTLTGSLMGGFMYVSGGGLAGYTTVDGGKLSLSGGSAFETNLSSGLVDVFSGGVAQDTYVGSGTMTVYSGGVATNTWVAGGGSMGVKSGGQHRGKLYLDAGCMVTVADCGVIDFDVAEWNIDDGTIVNDISRISCAKKDTAFAVTVPWMTTGSYYLAGGNLASDLTVTLKTPDGIARNTLSVGASCDIDGIGYTLNHGDYGYALTVTPYEGSCNAYGVSCSFGEGIIAYTKGDGYLIVELDESNSIINTYGLTGTYHWERYALDFTPFSGDVTGEAVSSPQCFRAYGNHNPDLFFANAKGTWAGGYDAKHVGFGDWSGTGKTVKLAGKNKIVDMFVGAYSESSGEPSVLVLTDDANGDALFLDDIFSESPMAVQQARLGNITEIRAGAGNDVVDLTSQRFSFGSQQCGGLTVYGGDGDDFIWANSGSNILFGDAGKDNIVGGDGDDFIIGGAGDDTLHGGGGSDTFCFGAKWGNDIVEQLANGEVTLWFKNGSSNNWDAAAMKYTDGLFSVTVRGVIADNVTLMFGDGTLSAPDGAFRDSASKRVFETSLFK